MLNRFSFFTRQLPIRRFFLSIAALIMIIATAGLLTLHPVQATTAIITVTDSTDSSVCTITISLRCALTTANANTSSPTTILFNFSGAIVLSGHLFVANAQQPITIDGSGFQVVINGGNATQMLNILGNAHAVIKALTFTNGNAGSGDGGAIYNAGTLSIDNCVFTSDGATYGGALFNLGLLTVSNSTFSHNNMVFPYSGAGGAIENHGGTVTIDGSTFSRNSFQSINNDNGGTLTISHTAFSFDYNQAVDNLGNNSVLTISDSSFSGSANGAILAEAGTTTITNILCTNTGDDFGVYGCITNRSTTGTLTINNSTVSGNSTGIVNYGTMTLNNSLVSGNTYRGIYVNGVLNINNSTITNSAEGILNYDTTTISNSTITNNTFGGIVNFNWLTLANSTISGNSVLFPSYYTSGGGISNNGTLHLISTIVAGNTLTGSTTGQDIGGIVQSLGHNLIGKGDGASGFMSSDQVGTNAAPIDPKLAALADNGGPTQTMALLSGSPAIGHGDCTGNASVNPPIVAVLFDQRSFGRKSPCDVGAFESNPTNTPTPTPTVNLTAMTATPSPTATATSTATATATQTSTPTITATPTATFTPSITPTASDTTTPLPPHIDSIGIYRGGTFFLRLHNTQGIADLKAAFTAGTQPYPIVGDWTGSGFDSIGVMDQVTDTFYLRNSISAGAPDETFTLGNPDDIPLAGRWDAGASHAGVGIFRPGSGEIYLKNALTSGYADYLMLLGLPGDSGIMGDWTGKGYDTPGVFRPSVTAFYLTNINTGYILYPDLTAVYGTATDLPIVGDWIAQGHDGLGLFRPTNGNVFLKNQISDGFADNNFFYGKAGDVPIAGHWQVIYPPIAPAPVLIAKTAAPIPNGGGIAPGGSQIGG